MKTYLKKFPFIRKIKNYIWNICNINGTHGTTKINILDIFPMFKPNSAGTYTARATLTVQAINQLVPSLVRLEQAFNRRRLKTISIDTLRNKIEIQQSTSLLKKLFDMYRSDKASSHNYHLLYSEILNDKERIRNIVEIGLGTNNTDVVSNMSTLGKPGASLRAFRDFLPQAMIYGADIDKRILFVEDRIETFYVDQTDPESFVILGTQVPDQCDLIIDDGLHSPHANINTLVFALPRLQVGGWIIIEDIATSTVPIWEIVAELLPTNYESRLYEDQNSYLFCVLRLS